MLIICIIYTDLSEYIIYHSCKQYKKNYYPRHNIYYAVSPIYIKLLDFPVRIDFANDKDLFLVTELLLFHLGLPDFDFEVRFLGTAIKLILK